jgi:hypothetical protein
VRHDTLELAAEAELKDVRPDAQRASCRDRDLGTEAKVLIHLSTVHLPAEYSLTVRALGETAGP